jgi:phosphate:Na+ symporter
MQLILDILSFLGALALFLFGMKFMSEGLEKFAGDRLRKILSAITNNRFMGVLTGLFITGVIQSSSATTVMVVSFVNAGLMTLAQAIGVIMGANIGTTVTAWIISFVGFKVNIAAFSFPLLAIGIPLIFSKKSKLKSIGEFIYGFSFLFMGLSFMSKGATDMNFGGIVANMLLQVNTEAFSTIVLLVLVGMVMTMIVQSSSATMAVTLMLFGMNIPGFGLVQAAAMAMGQNIGTTITALMASLTANTQARRAALAHTFFNVFGVIVFLPFIHQACDAVNWFVETVMCSDSNLYKLSAFHTAFNVTNTVLLIGFVKQIEMLICRILPMKEAEEDYRLKYISGGMLSTSELSIVQAKNEIGVFAERCHRMFELVGMLLHTDNENEFEKLVAKIEKYEMITDNMEMEIAEYLSKVNDGRLSSESKNKVQRMLRQIGELESIGDSVYHLGRTLNRHRLHNEEPFTPDQLKNMEAMLGIVDKALTEMRKRVGLDYAQTDLSESIAIEREINDFRNRLKEQNLLDVEEGLYGYQIGIYYMDFILECERLGDYVMNVVQAAMKMNNDYDE